MRRPRPGRQQSVDGVPDQRLCRRRAVSRPAGAECVCVTSWVSYSLQRCRRLWRRCARSSHAVSRRCCRTSGRGNRSGEDTAGCRNAGRSNAATGRRNASRATAAAGCRNASRTAAAAGCRNASRTAAAASGGSDGHLSAAAAGCRRDGHISAEPTGGPGSRGQVRLGGNRARSVGRESLPRRRLYGQFGIYLHAAR